MRYLPARTTAYPHTPETMHSTLTPHQCGLAYTFGAIVTWGLFPFYFKQLDQVDPLLVIGHRMFWAAGFMFFVMSLLNQWGEVKRGLTDPRLIRFSLINASLIGSSWILYVWAILNSHIVEASLGYYLTPILSVLLGLVVFREKLRPLQVLAVALAASGVFSMILINGIVPWIGIALGGIFALYSALRKYVDIPPMAGSFIECLLLAPPGLGILLYHGLPATLTQDVPTQALLIGSGIVTILPLTWYIAAAKLIPLATLGTLFYLAPTIGFLFGVFVYQEPFTMAHGVMFTLILLGLSLYTIDAFKIQNAAPGTVYP